MHAKRWEEPTGFPTGRIRLNSVSTGLLGILLLAQASALPVHIGLMLLPAHAAAMTQGCKKGTCCTPLCYLDKHGTHHCVHMQADSCECSVSTSDVDANPVFLSAILTLAKIENLLPDLIGAGRILVRPAFVKGHIPAIPSPPPK